MSAAVIELRPHQPWCTHHLSEDPADPLTAGADECGAVFPVLESPDVHVTVSRAPGDAEPVVIVEHQGRELTVGQAAQLHAVLGRALEAVRRQ
ncbi:hypothetical protein [Kribbella sp. NPDC051137]|uniref:hypothetical protein n=1 Tax=Kribbella sp. NPDC051137 TaxID=3155045 RepID=UPI00344770DE